MAYTMVQITHRFSERTPEEFAEQALPLAPYIAETPGLHWKLWMLNPAERSFCGLYLFEDEPAARAYLQGPIMEMVRNDTTNSNLRVELFELMEEPSAITRGPTPARYPAALRNAAGSFTNA